MLINSSRTTNMRMMNILFVFLYFLVLFILFTIKYVSILQFSHFPMNLVQLILWFVLYGLVNHAITYRSFSFFLWNKKNENEDGGVREWIKYELNKKHELSSCVRAFHHCKIFDRIPLKGKRLFFSFQLIERA